MSHHCCYDPQLRSGLGIQNLGGGHFEMRTMGNAWRLVAHHIHETGEKVYAKGVGQVVAD